MKLKLRMNSVSRTRHAERTCQELRSADEHARLKGVGASRDAPPTKAAKDATNALS